MIFLITVLTILLTVVYISFFLRNVKFSYKSIWREIGSRAVTLSFYHCFALLFLLISKNIIFV